VTEAVGFEVSGAAVQRLGRSEELNKPFAVPLPKEPEPPTMAQRVEALEKMVAAMKKDLYGAQEELPLN